MYPASSSGVTQLEFNQAMSDFKHMFPDMEEDVIETILRANNGVVDATIDQLLQINNEAQEKKKRNNKAALANNNNNNNNYNSNIFVEDGPSSATINHKSYTKDLNFDRKNSSLSSSSSSSSNVINSSHGHMMISPKSLRYKYRWQPPILGELSPDFLRITLNDTQRKLSNLNANNEPTNMMSSSFLQQKMEENKRNRQITSINDDPEMAQYLEDERFAILLQNEEFVRELRMNQDFMSTLESDNDSHYSSASNARNESGQTSNFLDSDAIFKERLRNMGKVSKKKFTQIARLFSGRMRKNFKQLDDSHSHSHSTGGHNREHQYFYHDLSNENYEDTAAALPSSSSSTTAAANMTDRHHNHQHHYPRI